MFAHDIGAEERHELYLVPDQGEPESQPPSRKILPFPSQALRPVTLRTVLGALVATLLLMPQLISHASTAITIDTDVLFGSVNDWISTFLPIFAIGLGIAIALAIIAIVGDSILMGLRRGVR